MLAPRREAAWGELGERAWRDLPSSVDRVKDLCRRRNRVRGTTLARSVAAMLVHERRRQVALGVPLRTLELVERFLDDRPRCRHCGTPWPLSRSF
jgi:hypothetical protein